MAKLTMPRPRIATADTRRVKPQPRPEKVADPFYASREWVALRDAERAAANGICRRIGCSNPGRIVDHVIEIKDGGARLDPANVELLCASCHGVKTSEARKRRSESAGPPAANHPNWLKPSRIPLLVVCGPPASGKSTYARQWLQGNGLLIDLDEITAHLSKTPIYMAGKEWLNAAVRHRNSMLIQLAMPAAKRWRRAAFIVGEPSAEKRQWWDDKLKPHQIVVCETAEDVCLSRIAADPRRSARAQDMGAAVMAWWSRYTPRSADLVIKS